MDCGLGGLPHRERIDYRNVPAWIDSGYRVVASGEMWPNHACCSLVVSGKLIRDNPEMVKQIILIHRNATKYINEHPDEAAEIYAEKTGQDIDQVKQSLRTWDGKWISDPHAEIPSTLS